MNCSPCRREIPEMNFLVEYYANRDVVFLAVALDEREAIKKFVQQRPYTYSLMPAGNM
ncbi:TlpA disulfide reductase family protein [Hymenobacter sp.]|uniref:TlpA disulfide reductase family protein n=1 Tax=Hymenobacter sp. TaxID=1898978 RepID=UPI002ED810B2